MEAEVLKLELDEAVKEISRLKDEIVSIHLEHLHQLKEFKKAMIELRDGK